MRPPCWSPPSSDSAGAWPVVLVLGPARSAASPAWPACADLAAAVQGALAAALPVMVVTSPGGVSQAQPLVAQHDILVLPDGDWLGPGSGAHVVGAAVQARAQSAGWVLLPAAMGAVRPETLWRVAGALRTHPASCAQHGGRRGHPVGFGAALFSELLRLQGADGHRRLLARFPVLAVDVDDAAVRQGPASEWPGCHRRCERLTV